MRFEDLGNYQWYKITSNRAKADYVPYIADTREQGDNKLKRDLSTKECIWPIYFSTGKPYQRKVSDVVSYAPCSLSEIQFVFKEKVA